MSGSLENIAKEFFDKIDKSAEMAGQPIDFYEFEKKEEINGAAKYMMEIYEEMEQSIKDMRDYSDYFTPYPEP